MNELQDITLSGVGFRIHSRDDFKLIPIIAWFHREFPLVDAEVSEELEEEFYTLLKMQVACDRIRKFPRKVKNRSLKDDMGIKWRNKYLYS